MRRVVALLSAGVLALASTLPAAAAEPTSKVVVHADYQCVVSWYVPSDPGDWGPTDPSCEILNVRTPNGVFTEVLHGQIPADQMDAFRAAGSPSSFAINCLVNYGWLSKYHAGEDWGPLMVFTRSVRHFNPDGRMTEVCAPSIARNALP